MADSVKIKIDGDDSDFKSKMSELGKNAAKALGNAGSAIATSLGAGLAAAGAGFTKLTKDALDSVSSLEQNIGGSEKVFAGFEENVQRAAKEAYNQAGLSMNDYLESANKMGALMQGSGLSIEESLSWTEQVMQRASDVASIMGIDVKDAIEAVTGAAKGNFTMMDNLGVAMNATTLEEYALSRGINKTYNEMSNGEKVQLAYQMFLEKTAYAQGNYAKENDTVAGSLTTLKAAYDNFLSGAGDADQLVDAFTNASDVVLTSLDSILPRLTEGLSSIMEKISPQIPAMIQKLLPSLIAGAKTLLAGLVNNLPGLLKSLLSSAKDIVDVIVGIIPEVISSLLEVLPDALSSLGEIILVIVDVFSNSLPDLVVGLVSLFTQLFSALADATPKIMPKLVDALIEGLISLLENSPQMIEAGFSFITALITGIVSAVPMLIDRLPEILDGLKEAFDSIFHSIVDSGASILASIWTAISGDETSSDDIKEYFSGLWGDITAGVTNFAEKAGNVLATIWDALSGDESAKEDIANYFNNLWSEVTSYIDAAAEAGGEILTTIWNAILGDEDAMESIRTTLSDFFGGIADGIVSAWNSVVEAIKAATAAIEDFLGIQPSTTYYYGMPGAHSPNFPGKAVGMDYVPNDNFPVLLHKGEAVLTASENHNRMTGLGGSSVNIDKLFGQMTNNIIAAINSIDVNMSGEKVGRVVASTVSEVIADGMWSEV